MAVVVCPACWQEVKISADSTVTEHTTNGRACWGAGSTGWSGVSAEALRVARDPRPRHAVVPNAPSTHTRQVATAESKPRARQPVITTASTDKPTTNKDFMREYELSAGIVRSEAQQLLSANSLPWGAWSDSPGQSGYGKTIGLAARERAMGLLPPQQDPAYEEEVARWSTRRAERTKYDSIITAWGVPLLVIGAASVASSVIFGADAFWPGALAAFGTVVAIWGWLLWRRSTLQPGPRPQASPDTFRDESVEKLANHLVRVAKRLDQERRGALDPAALFASVDQKWQPLGPRPAPMESASWQEAEELAGAWLRWLGCSKVRVTQATRDGGVDVIAPGLVAQVKLQTQAVSPLHVRALHGVASTHNSIAVFFASGGYSKAATEFADDAGIALFHFNPATASLRAASTRARRLLETGFPSNS